MAIMLSNEFLLSLIVLGLSLHLQFNLSIAEALLSLIVVVSVQLCKFGEAMKCSLEASSARLSSMSGQVASIEKRTMYGQHQGREFVRQLKR